jgi:hypothetical protein
LAETTLTQGDAMNNPNRLRKGQAVREYFAVKDEIKKMISKGCDLWFIYQQLTASGRITMSYKTLHYHQVGKTRKLQNRDQVVKTRFEPVVTPQSVTEISQIQAPSQAVSETKTHAPARPRPSPHRDSVPIQSPECPNNPGNSGGSLDSLLEEVQSQQKLYLESNPEQQAIAERLLGI